MSNKECFVIAILLLVAVALVVFLTVIFSIVLIRIDPCYFIGAVGIIVLAELIKLSWMIDSEAHAEYERRIFKRTVRL